MVSRRSGDPPTSVVETPHRRTKWSPQAKWRPADVGGRESRSPRTGGPRGPLGSTGDQVEPVNLPEFSD